MEINLRVSLDAGYTLLLGPVLTLLGIAAFFLKPCPAVGRSWWGDQVGWIKLGGWVGWVSGLVLSIIWDDFLETTSLKANMIILG